MFWSTFFDTLFSNIPDANPCEDQYLAGYNHEQYPGNPQPYDCGSRYFDGWNDSISEGHFGSNTSIPYDTSPGFGDGSDGGGDSGGDGGGSSD